MKPVVQLFNWYRRYRVRAVDMEVLENSLRDNIDGLFEGLADGAVLDGLEVSFPGGLNVTVSAGIAAGPSGEYEAASGSETVALASPAGNPCRSLIVIRPLITQTDYITRPTSPFDSVALHVNYGAQLVVLNGTPAAAPVYPTPAAGDVIVAGFRLTTAAAAVTQANVDFDVRDALGKNATGLQGIARYDQRCYAYRSATAVVGITPSQPVGAAPVGLMYAGAAKPLIFPKTGGVFTASDALLNFTTGAITGGDGDSADFTPSIPTAGNFIWAVVTVSVNSLLSVTYGTLGTYAQCKAAMRSQVSSGAGAVPTTAAAKLCYVLLGSSTGAAITEIEIVDARGPGSFASLVNQAITVVNSANTPYTMDGTEAHIQVDASAGAVVINLPDRALNQGTDYPIDRIDSTTANAVTINRAGADTIDDPIFTTSYPIEIYQSLDFFAGSTMWKVR